MKIRITSLVLCMLMGSILTAQRDNATVQALIKEAIQNSQLESLAHQITDVLGPRLVGTPQMQAANDWAVQQYASWGIEARNEQWGEWRGWERGISHIDMLEPRVQSAEFKRYATSLESKYFKGRCYCRGYHPTYY